MKITKRDGRKVEFDSDKIVKAISKAFIEVYPDGLTDEMQDYAHRIADEIAKSNKDMAVEDVQNVIIRKLMASKWKDVATAYVEYRYRRKLVRQSNTTDKVIKELLDGENEYWNTENSNKNPKVVTTQRDYMAGVTSTDISRRFLLPKEVVEAHDLGIIHFHDLDYFAQLSLHNCELINIEDMLQNGTVINEVMIDKPRRLITAATITTQIIMGVTSSSYGGATINLGHLAPFVIDSYNRYVKQYRDRGVDESTANEWAKLDTRKEIEDAVQTFNYQVNSMTNTNGQAPFLSVFMWIGENPEYEEATAALCREFLKQRIKGFKNSKGEWITPAFPKLLYVLDENNIHEDSPYWDVTVMAAKCTAQRMVPDYISAKIMRRDKVDKNGNGQVYGCMGCRSFLTPYVDANGKPKYWGRFNQGVVTINLPDVALSSGGDVDTFWKILDERLELCHKALQCRHERLALATSDVAPILWQHGALARLPKHTPIHPLLHDGYSTISLGYAGLYECVKYMTGESHSHGIGYSFGIEVMERLNEYTAKWKAEEHIDYSLYGSPIESTTYKFAQCLKNRFGIIEGITDRDYITNSYHVNVREPIDPFEKLEIESKYQKLSPGGAISYIECADLTGNTEAVLEVIKFIYDHIMYAEMNTKSDYCQVCGSHKEMEIVDEDGKLSWRCSVCGNTDQSKMNVARRTCGYIGTQFWNQGRTQEINERYVHLDNHEVGE